MAIKPVEILITAKDKASEVFGGLKATAVAAGVAIAGYFGVKLFSEAVTSASELEAKLSEVQAVSGATAAQMDALRKAAEDAGASTKFSAAQSAEALGNLARAGLSAEQAIAALPATLQLAQAGGLALADASTIVTRTISGFNLAASDAGRIADVLAMGANASNTSVTGLGDALSYAAPTAVGLGLSLETTVAIIGKFADAGIDASRAGTALNSILSQFSDPASKFRTELAAAGITTTDFETALRQLAAAGPAGAKAVLAVGTEAGPALRALLNQGIGALDDLKGKLDAAAGSAATTADTMGNNLTGALGGLSSAWESVKNALATPVLPVLRDGVTQLTDALRAAVQDGTVGKFGTAIANGFQSALTWARAFIAEVDFVALSAKVTSAADKVGAAFVTLEGYAKTTGNSVALIWGTMSAGANTVLFVVYKVGEAFAGVASNIMTGVALIREGLSKITFGSLSAGFKEAADDMRLSAEATWAASQALAQKAEEALAAVANGAETARSGWAGLTEDASAATTQATTSASAFDSMATTLASVGTAATAAGTTTRDELTKTAATANATAAEIEAAFTRMGVQTKDQLAQAAANAQRDFELIRTSGQATTAGLQTAFVAYAQAAIAANNGVATEALKTQATMQGLEVTVDATGKTIVRAMGSGAQAMSSYAAATQTAAAGQAVFATAADRATQALIAQNTALERQIAAQEKANELAQRAIDLENKRRGVDAQGFAADSKGNRITAGGDLTTLTGIANFLKNAGLDDAQAKTVAREFSDSQGNISYFSNPGQMKYGGANSTISEALLKAAERTTFAGGANGAQAVGRTVQVNINTGNARTETVNTDEAGAAAVVRALQAASLSAGR